MHAPDLGLIHRRGLVGLVGHVFDLLQVVGNAQHHRAALMLGDVEGLAHVVHHARHAMRRDVTRPGRRHQRRLVDGLVVELGVDRRLAGEHHQRQAGANRGRQRRHQLGHAGAARDRGNGDLAGRHVVGCRRRDGRVLVPDVDGMHARQFGEGGAPVHVAVAHQDELRVDSLRKERFCEGFVEFGHGRGDCLDDEVIRYATTMPGEAQSIRLNGRSLVTRRAGLGQSRRSSLVHDTSAPLPTADFSLHRSERRYGATTFRRYSVDDPHCRMLVSQCGFRR